MKMFNWIRGRAGSGYDKMLLCSSTYLRFDVWILKFPTGSFIAPHTDQVTCGKHYRLNIVLKKANRGGIFICNNVIWQMGRIVLFRPDVETHHVEPVISGTRYVLSIGWIRQ